MIFRLFQLSWYCVKQVTTQLVLTLDLVLDTALGHHLPTGPHQLQASNQQAWFDKRQGAKECRLLLLPRWLNFQPLSDCREPWWFWVINCSIAINLYCTICFCSHRHGRLRWTIAGMLQSSYSMSKAKRSVHPWTGLERNRSCVVLSWVFFPLIVSFSVGDVLSWTDRVQWNSIQVSYLEVSSKSSCKDCLYGKPCLWGGLDVLVDTTSLPGHMKREVFGEWEGGYQWVGA